MDKRFTRLSTRGALPPHERSEVAGMSEGHEGMPALSGMSERTERSEGHEGMPALSGMSEHLPLGSRA